MPKNYYVLCDDDCKYEGMTKEQTLTAIEQAVETGAVSDPDSAVISKIKEIRANGTAQIWLGTEAQFNALSPAPSVGYTFVRVGADGIMYICTDDQTSSTLLNHAEDKNNPHEVTPDQIGAAAATHTHNMGDVTGLIDALNDTASAHHTQSASTITAGMLGGEVTANHDAMANSDAQVRDIVFVTADPGAGVVSDYPSGTVILVYE